MPASRAASDRSRSTARHGGTQDATSLAAGAPGDAPAGSLAQEQPLVAPQAGQAKQEPARVMTFPHW